MAIHEFPDGQKVTYDPDLYVNISDMRRAVKFDRDCLILIAGRPGVGKSVLGLQVAKLLDPDFTEDNIVFDHEKLIDKAISLKPQSALVWDEAREGLSNRNATTEKNKRVLDFLAEVRQRNLKLVFIMPDFWDFEMPVACVRSDCLIHVYQIPNPDYEKDIERKDPFERGHFGFYNFDRKKRLYILGKKFHTFLVKPNFVGRFNDQYVVNEKRYRDMKFEALRVKKLQEEKKEKAAIETLKDPRKYWLKEDVVKRIKSYLPHMTQKEMAKMLQCDDGTISELLLKPSVIGDKKPSNPVDAFMEAS